MGNLADHQRMRGEGVHIGDCYVWAEIYYLDSPTDYREYLPQDCDKGPRTIPLDDWILLESSEHAPGRGAQPSWSLIAFLFVLLICWQVFYGIFGD